MYLKQIIIIQILFTGIYLQGQVNYLAVDYCSFDIKHKYAETASAIPSGKITSSDGTYIGESFHLALSRYNFFSLGLGLTTINYEKQWLGIFRESNQLGAATLKGSIQYLSLPFSLSLISGTGIRHHYYKPNKSPFRFGINITYVPSFQTKNSFSMNTFGTADSSAFFSNYKPDTREFQHSITIGFCNQFLLCNKKLRLSVEPYTGYGSSFFNPKHGSSTLTYGVKLQLGIHLKVPKISIEREAKPGNYNDKKKELEQKQKEIEQQLNKPN